jgi:hypothetical protein
MMKKKLLFTVLVTICISYSFGQTPTDTISIQKVFGGYQYYQGYNRLGFSQMINLMQSNEQASNEIRAAQKNSSIASITGYVGGFMLGWPLGTAIGGGRPNWAMAGVGAGILAVGITLNQKSNKQTTNAIRIYNESITSESFLNNVQIDYLFTLNGVGFRMRF